MNIYMCILLFFEEQHKKLNQNIWKMVRVKQKVKSAFTENLSIKFLMLAMFFNPFGFDIVQYQLISLTGDLWRANFVLYCLAVLFFGLSILFRKYYKK